MNNALDIKGLRKDFNDFSINDISLSLPTGYIMGLVGKNGAGKTTTIRLILNMLARDGGSIKVFGLDNIVEEAKIKQDIAVVFDEMYFVDTWKIPDVEKALKGFYVNWNSKLFNQYIKKFHLSTKKQVKELSRGMKMKLQLAVAMSHDAKLLILDEPTSGLDPVARDELIGIFGEYISDGQRSILFSTHITTDLQKIADFITLIKKGNIFFTGTKDDFLESFCLVKGGPNELPDVLREKMIGLTTNRTGFEGLLPSSEIKYLPKELVAETPSIDEILVYISKGEETYE